MACGDDGECKKIYKKNGAVLSLLPPHYNSAAAQKSHGGARVEQPCSDWSCAFHHFSLPPPPRRPKIAETHHPWFRWQIWASATGGVCARGGAERARVSQGHRYCSPRPAGNRAGTPVSCLSPLSSLSALCLRLFPCSDGIPEYLSKQ